MSVRALESARETKFGRILEVEGLLLSIDGETTMSEARPSGEDPSGHRSAIGEVAPQRVDRTPFRPTTRPTAKRFYRRWLVIAVIVLVLSVSSLYVLSQDPVVSRRYSVSVVTTCICPAPVRVVSELGTHSLGGTQIVANDAGVGWLAVPPISAVSGTWSVSNNTDVLVMFLYGPQNYTNGSATSGTFHFSGPAPWGWPSASQSWGGVWFDILSPYPVMITISGTFTSPVL
jgi:hypothetical protein